jgi:hypothetical protein
VSWDKQGVSATRYGDPFSHQKLIPRSHSGISSKIDLDYMEIHHMTRQRHRQHWRSRPARSVIMPEKSPVWRLGASNEMHMHFASASRSVFRRYAVQNKGNRVSRAPVPFCHLRKGSKGSKICFWFPKTLGKGGESPRCIPPHGRGHRRKWRYRAVIADFAGGSTGGRSASLASVTVYRHMACRRPHYAQRNRERSGDC